MSILGYQQTWKKNKLQKNTYIKYIFFYYFKEPIIGIIQNLNLLINYEMIYFFLRSKAEKSKSIKFVGTELF